MVGEHKSIINIKELQVYHGKFKSIEDFLLVSRFSYKSHLDNVNSNALIRATTL